MESIEAQIRMEMQMRKVQLVALHQIDGMAPLRSEFGNLVVVKFVVAICCVVEGRRALVVAETESADLRTLSPC